MVEPFSTPLDAAVSPSFPSSTHHRLTTPKLLLPVFDTGEMRDLARFDDLISTCQEVDVRW
jgi:hypothetical protein